MKNRRLSIKLTDYELQQLKEEAIRRGTTQSELLRSFIARLRAPAQKPSSEGRGFRPNFSVIRSGACQCNHATYRRLGSCFSVPQQTSTFGVEFRAKNPTDKGDMLSFTL